MFSTECREIDTKLVSEKLSRTSKLSIFSEDIIQNVIKKNQFIASFKAFKVTCICTDDFLYKYYDIPNKNVKVSRQNLYLKDLLLLLETLFGLSEGYPVFILLIFTCNQLLLMLQWHYYCSISWGLTEIIGDTNSIIPSFIFFKVEVEVEAEAAEEVSKPQYNI